MSSEPKADKNEPVAPFRELGLTEHEFSLIERALRRPPNALELSMYAVMWSEHCSYKSSRRHLGQLPTKGERVLVGPGENAGVIDVGDGIAIAIRIESHNHPSFITPYEGAATGVGGILRDVFTMGARPIALMDSLFVGTLDEPHSRYILDGVVRGVAGYGNSVGVPTVGGSITLDRTYRNNPLVNVFCLGLLRIDELVLAKASGPGNLAVLLGSSTGRDGIGGVSVLASASFGTDEPGEAAAKRPAVQVGDPYEEKRLIEACMEILSNHLAVGVQDLGGGGLSCATSETAGRAGLGMDVIVDDVPRREAGMTPIEVMTSESQERMLAIVTQEDLARVMQVCRRFEVDAAVIGTVTEPDRSGVGRLRIISRSGEVYADVPAASLSDDAPNYERLISKRTEDRADLEKDPKELPAPTDCGNDLLALMQDPSWIFGQYDHQLFLNTILGPGDGDATVLRLCAPGIEWNGKALALSTDSNPTWCRIDPYWGTVATVAESTLNVALTGAAPIGLVNCLNFGDPENPVVMWELTQSIAGMSMACESLSLPVVGGNVSLYNASGGTDIDPTPVVAVVGLIDELLERPRGLLWTEEDSIVVLGGLSRSLVGSRWACQIYDHRGGVLDHVDLASHARLCELVAKLAATSCSNETRPVVRAIHDVSDGGLAVCLAELCLASGLGCHIDAELDHAALFSEAPSRVVIATPRPDDLFEIARDKGIEYHLLGSVGGERLFVAPMLDLSIDQLRQAASASISGHFASGAAPVGAMSTAGEKPGENYINVI